MLKKFFLLFVVKHVVKHCNVVHFCTIKHVFIRVVKLLAQWLHQKLNDKLQQEKQLVQEKEMQRQKLQHEKNLQPDVDVVHQQKDLQDEELLAEGLQENLLEDLVHEEGDVNLLPFFSKLRSNFAKSLSCKANLNKTN